ncbi:MAG: response regulator transcription factor [Gammaproteobacteria bacterium]|nr:response regulator transcription factor [Gammaproteobacteria bacterium]
MATVAMLSLQTKTVIQRLNLLLVEDQSGAAAGMYKLLSPLFKRVLLATSVATARQQFATTEVDLLLTDIELPDGDGLALVELLRQQRPLLPVIVLSAYTDRDYLLRAANLKLDGYIVKPLNFAKLERSLSSVVQALPQKESNFQFAPHGHYLLKQRQLHLDGREIPLGSKQRLLLELLLTSSPEVVSAREIETRLWPEKVVTASALKNQLLQLREKLGDGVIHNSANNGWFILPWKS